MEQQEENIAELDTKVDVAMDSVVTIGDKVMEHEKEIIELGDGLERLDEKLDDVDLSWISSDNAWSTAHLVKKSLFIII